MSAPLMFPSRGDNLSTMYTHILWGTQARRDHLKATKYFTCHCKRCADPTELGTHLSSLKCIGVNPSDVATPCSGLILPLTADENTDWKCGSCPVTLTSAHVAELMSRISADVDENMENPNVPKMEQFLSKLGKLLHRNHYHCFMVKHSLIQLYGREPGHSLSTLTETQLNKKMEMCKELLGVIDAIDPGHGRIALYSSVVQIELQSALLEKSRRAEKDVEKERLLTEAKSQLENCILDLVHEPPFSPGASMSNLAKSHLIAISQELKNFKVIEL